jgi:hypothetical protein
MRRGLISLLTIVAGLGVGTGAHADDLPLGTRNCVHLKTAAGVEERCGAAIAGGSLFVRVARCRYEDPSTHELVEGASWDFVEHALTFWPPTFSAGNIKDWALWLQNQDRKYPDGFRVFDEYCGNVYLRTFAVPLSDPFFDPTARIEELERSLLIPTPELVTVPDTSIWGGLVVNVHAFFGIRAAVWQPLESPLGDFLGVPLRLVAIPRELSFTVDGHAVPCVAAPTNRPAEGDVFPPEPAGFRDEKLDPPDDPLPPQPCVWTPRRPGSATVTATITYTVRALYGPGAIVRPDFVRTTAFTVPIVELKVVNTRP